jgi:hypothetical protein
MRAGVTELPLRCRFDCSDLEFSSSIRQVTGPTKIGQGTATGLNNPPSGRKESYSSLPSKHAQTEIPPGYRRALGAELTGSSTSTFTFFSPSYRVVKSLLVRLKVEGERLVTLRCPQRSNCKPTLCRMRDLQSFRHYLHLGEPTRHQGRADQSALNFLG